MMNCCLNPGLGDVLLELYGSDSVVDVGAGQGTYELYAFAKQSASNWTSFDATNGIEQQTHGRVRFRDAVAAADVQGLQPADWAQCIETAEHVPAAQQAALIANLHYLNRKGVVVSWALPGQPGHAHINCRTNEYVESLFEALGYERQRWWEARARGEVAAAINATALKCSHKELPPSECGDRNWARFAFWGSPEPSFGPVLQEKRLSAKAGCINAAKSNSGARNRASCGMLPNCMAACPWLHDSIMIFTRRAAAGGSEAAAAPPQPTAREAQKRLSDGLEEERRRLAQQLRNAAALKQRLMQAPPGSAGDSAGFDAARRRQELAEKVQLPEPL